MEKTNSNIEKDSKKPKQERIVLYCGVCGLPPEYCEFNPDFEKCKPWILQNCPNIYPELASSIIESNKIQTSEEKKEEVKMLPGGKVKKKEVPKIHISRTQRNKRKCVTVVQGLDKFG